MNADALELFAEENPGVRKADGLDDGIIGHARFLGRAVLIYDYWKCVRVLMDLNEWDRTDALEWMEYNVVDGIGEESPVFVEVESEDSLPA